MRSWLKSGRTNKSTHHINLFPETQHPDLPLKATPPPASPRPPTQTVNRSSSVSEHFSSGYAGDRRSIAIEPGYDHSLPFSPDDIVQPSPALSGGLTRSQTVLRKESVGWNSNASAQPSPSPLWAPDLAVLPTPSEQIEAQPQEHAAALGDREAMSQYQQVPQPKTSSDSGQSAALDRWSQRRLQRLNTEQGFREQRQGGVGHGIYSPQGSLSEQSAYNNSGASLYQAQEQHAQSAQPHPAPQPAYQSERTSHLNAGLTAQAQPVSSATRSTSYRRPDTTQVYLQSNQQYSSPDSTSQPNVSEESLRPSLNQSRSYNQQQQASGEDSSMSSTGNGNLPAPRAQRSGGSNRQSMHNGVNSREGSTLGNSQQSGGQLGGVPAFSPSLVPTTGQGQPGQTAQQQKSDIGRNTPQPPPQTSDDMSEEDINQLIKDHKELREKYTKVKKYYFEKEDQVKSLQNSLAHQRLSQSRTSLDDSEYATRFNRLDGLIAQLAFSIRKNWRTIPGWLVNTVNKDAVATGKQEMTAAGRAFISAWLVDEVFDKYFHPDLDPMLSSQLKSVQKNIRRFAPLSQTAEEEEYLTSKVINWRLSTLEGLSDVLKSPQCPANRSQLTDMLKEHLISALSQHLQEPPPSDLEGGVHMIIELVVSIAIHLPLESRDVVIDYYPPGYSILHDHMKLETGIPPLTISVADDVAERSSLASAGSDGTDNTDHMHGEQPSKKRSMLNALTGQSKSKSNPGDPRKHAGAGGSSSSLNRPDSSQGSKSDQPPKVRMAAGIGVQIRGRSVLVKAPVFATP